MGFELGCKCTCQKRSHEHDGKGYGIFASIGDQRQPGFCQKIIEQDDTQKGGQHAAGISAGKGGGQKHTQQINHDDIGIRKAKPQKQPPDDRSGCQNPDSQKQFPGGWKRRANGEKWFPGIAFTDLRIRNDVNVHLRRKRNELFCQRRFAPEMPSLHAAAPNYDFGHIGESRIFRNLRWYIFSMCCDDLCTKLLCKTYIRLQSSDIFCVHARVSGGLHIERGKASAKCLRHFPCHSYNTFIGWGRGQAHQNMLF